MIPKMILAKNTVFFGSTACPFNSYFHLAYISRDAIAEADTGRVYFLGNRVSKCQQMIANYVMGCELPIADANKGERLPFQDKLEEKMKTFTLAEFKNGTFFAHD